MKPYPIKVVFIIPGLPAGGAEMMLKKLLSRIDRKKVKPVVVSLTDVGVVGPVLIEMGIALHCLKWSAGRVPLIGVVRLVRLLREIRPDIVQGWMYHGNVAALVAAKVAALDVPVVWGIRGTHTDLRREKWLSALVIYASAKMSACPDLIINNSYRSVELHVSKLAYSGKRTLVIPNGFDTELFIPSSRARSCLRAELGLTEEAMLVGLVARFHPMKNHKVFLRAASTVRRRWPNVSFVMVGEGVDSNNEVLSREIDELALRGSVHLLGLRRDTPYIMAALDIATSTSSYGEGFPNVIGEAMSCGVVCVATDVGDSKHIIGEYGVTVPPDSEIELVRALEEILAYSEHRRRELGLKARQQIVERYSLNAVTRKFEEAYESLCADSLV